MRDTIVALSSGRLPSAVAIVRCSGPGALEAARAIAGTLPDPRIAALRDFHDPRDSTLIDQGLLLVFPGPASATGEDIVEYQCHGSRAVVGALLGALTSRDGIREAEPGEFTRRALSNGRLDLIQAEGLGELLDAETALQHRIAIDRVRGVMSDRLEGWRERLLRLSAMAEMAIDYDDEHEAGTVEPFEAEIRALADEWAEALAAPRIEPLRDGIRVVLVGAPNTGKSSLFNALLGETRAIVTDIEGTTRDSIEAPIALGLVPIVLVDTAGLRNSHDRVEALGISRSRAEIERADLIVSLDNTVSHDQRTVRVSPKSDIAPRGEGLPVSAVTGAGIQELLADLGKRAEELLPSNASASLNAREAEALGRASASLMSIDPFMPPEVIADRLRAARGSFDELTGRVSIESVLDALFARFCVGK